MHSHCQEPNPCHNFCPTPEQKCLFEYFKPEIQNMIDESQPDLSVINVLIDGIDNYECVENKVYQCKDIILYKGYFYESLKNNNDRHPHDERSWKQHGKLKDIFSTLSKLQEVSNISVEYHHSCDITSNCKPFYMEGDLVAIKVDTGKVDSCGSPIFEDVYYVSLIDNNIEIPSEDAEDWKGPITVEELLSGGAISGATVCAAISELPNQCESV